MGNTIMRVASFNHSSAAAMSSSEESTSVAATVRQGKAPFQRIRPSGQSVPRIPRKSTRPVENYQPYYYNSATFVMITGQFKVLTDLQQQRVGVQRGSTHQNYLLATHPSLSVVTYDSYQNALLDLHNGRIQAVFADSAVAHCWLKQQPQLAQLGPLVRDPRYFGQGVAIAVRQEDTALLAQLNQALTTLEQQGQLQAIHHQWFK